MLALFALGLCAGLLGSVLGIGGGIVIVPALSLLFGLPLTTAIGTSVVGVVATSTASAISYVRDEITNVRLGMTLETTTVVGAMAGGLLAALLPTAVLTVLYIGILLVSAQGMWRRREPAGDTPAPAISPGLADGLARRLASAYHDPRRNRLVSYEVQRAGTGLAGSLGAGLLSGLFGVGGGIIKVPLMTVVMQVPIKAAVATSSFMIGVTGAASAFIYYFRGFIEPAVAVPVVLGVIASSLAGARLAPRLRSAVLTRVFAILIMIVAARMLWDAAAMLRP